MAIVAEAVDEAGSVELVCCSGAVTAGVGAVLVLELGADVVGAGEGLLTIVFSTAALKRSFASPARRSRSSWPLLGSYQRFSLSYGGLYAY